MRKRQKLLLTIYALVIFILSFAYAPYICHYEAGVDGYAGHHWRATAKKFIPRHSYNTYRFCTIDSFLLFNEMLGITIVTGSLYFLLSKKKKD
jgi:hypothetical protein